MSRTPSQISKFIAKYSPSIGAQFRSARSHVRKLIPCGHELVYDNYNALGCGFSTTSKSSDIFLSVVAYPKWVTLFFFHGVHLPDPEGMLQGSGVRIRSLRLQPFTLLQSDEVGELLAHAIHAVEPELATAPRMTTVVKSVSARQRPRRPAEKSTKKRAKSVRRFRAS
jgi:hypothetical protein